MWEKVSLEERQGAEGQREENRKNEEGDQLWKGFHNVARVPKRYSGVFEHGPEAVEGADHDREVVFFSDPHFVETGTDNQHSAKQVVGCVEPQ